MNITDISKQRYTTKHYDKTKKFRQSNWRNYLKLSETALHQ